MVDFWREPMWALMAIKTGCEDAVYAPGVADLNALLEQVRSGAMHNCCVECRVRLLNKIEGELNFIRVNHPGTGDFRGWLIQLANDEDYSSFVLANMQEACEVRCLNDTEIELLGCLDSVDTRCLFSHQEVQFWIDQELAGQSPVTHYRWIDFALAIRQW